MLASRRIGSTYLAAAGRTEWIRRRTRPWRTGCLAPGSNLSRRRTGDFDGLCGVQQLRPSLLLARQRADDGSDATPREGVFAFHLAYERQHPLVEVGSAFPADNHLAWLV